MRVPPGGEEFFEVLVANLSETLGVRGAWVTEYLEDEGRLRSIAFWYDGALQSTYEYDVAGTPCEAVVAGEFVHIADRVVDLYPADPDLEALEAVAYLGYPFTEGRNLGANPVEYILHAAVACLTTTFVYYAAAEGVKVDAIETSVEGDLDIRGLLGLSKDATVEYERIRMTMKVTADAPEEKIRELVRLAEMRSPSFNSVARPVPIDVRPIKA